MMYSEISDRTEGNEFLELMYFQERHMVWSFEDQSINERIMNALTPEVGGLYRTLVCSEKSQAAGGQTFDLALPGLGLAYTPDLTKQIKSKLRGLIIDVQPEVRYACSFHSGLVDARLISELAASLSANLLAPLKATVHPQGYSLIVLDQTGRLDVRKVEGLPPCLVSHLASLLDDFDRLEEDIRLLVSRAIRGERSQFTKEYPLVICPVADGFEVFCQIVQVIETVMKSLFRDVQYIIKGWWPIEC